MSDKQQPPIITGLPVDLLFTDPAQGDAELSMRATVSAVKDSLFHLTFDPKLGDTPPPMEAPFLVKCRMPKDTHLWSYTTRVVKAVDNVWVLSFPNPADVLCEQRREHVRAMVNIDGQAATYMAGRLFGEAHIEIIDISGGGCQIASEKPFIPNATLRVKIPLPDRTISVLVKVIRASAFPQRYQKKRPYIAGTLFTEITPADREYLIKYVFNSMRKGIQQGKV